MSGPAEHDAPARLRVAVPADQPAIAAVERAAAALYVPFGLEGFFGNGVSRTARFADALAAGGVEVATTADDRVVGFAWVQPHPPYAYLAELDVDPAHGRRGIGTRLLHAAIARAGSLGAEALWLTTQDNIPWNAPWYARHGFARARGRRLPRFVREILSRQQAIGFPMVHRVAMVRVVGREA